MNLSFDAEHKRSGMQPISASTAGDRLATVHKHTAKNAVGAVSLTSEQSDQHKVRTMLGNADQKQA